MNETMMNIIDTHLPLPDGNMATYIPGLAKQNPAHWGVAICTVDGQRTLIGDTDVGSDYCVLVVGVG
jgi:glutaminase